MDKGKLIDDLCSLCDSISETSFMNHEKLKLLLNNYPKSTLLIQINLQSIDNFEHHNIGTLRRFDREQLKNFHEEAMLMLDNLMNDEVQLDTLEVKLQQSKGQAQKNQKEDSSVNDSFQISDLSNIKISEESGFTNRDNWDFLRTTELDKGNKPIQPIENRLDALMQGITNIKKNISQQIGNASNFAQQLLQATDKLTFQNDYQEKFEQQLRKTQNLEQQILSMKDQNQKIQQEIIQLKEESDYQKQQQTQPQSQSQRGTISFEIPEFCFQIIQRDIKLNLDAIFGSQEIAQIKQFIQTVVKQNSRPNKHERIIKTDHVILSKVQENQLQQNKENYEDGKTFGPPITNGVLSDKRMRRIEELEEKLQELQVTEKTKTQLESLEAYNQILNISIVKYE